MKKNISIKDLTNLSNLCRVCLTESKTMTPLMENLESEGNTTIIWSFLSTISDKKINTDSKYPSSICPMCLGLLKICCKLKLQFNESQQLLADYYGESAENYDSECTVQDNKQNYSTVELISSRGVFNLKDVVIVENPDIDMPNYDGFLKNLGTEISATFVGETNFVTKPILNQESTIIDFASRSEKENDCINRVAQCPLCKGMYTNGNCLKRHLILAHYNKHENFMCELCGQFLKTRSRLYHHMVKHDGKKHHCAFCKKVYFSSSHLRLHVEAVHFNKRPHLCTVCGKNFNYANALTYHMRLHTGERKYNCTYCDKKFRMGCSLKRHLVSHTGMRNYKCSYCDKALKSRNELLCHEMTHTGFRPYYCKYCQKGFIKNHNLKLHLMNHGGQHVCDVCNKNFIEVEFLKFHMQKIHGI